MADQNEEFSSEAGMATRSSPKAQPGETNRGHLYGLENPFSDQWIKAKSTTKFYQTLHNSEKKDDSNDKYPSWLCLFKISKTSSGFWLRTRPTSQACKRLQQDCVERHVEDVPIQLLAETKKELF